MTHRSGAVMAILTVLKRPDLWSTAVGLLWRVRPRRGFGIPKEYVEFRLHTAYGDEPPDPKRRDLVTYLEWVQVQRAAR